MTDTLVDSDREADYLERLRKLVLAELEGLDCEAFLFGSRARGGLRRASDFDIGIRGLSAAEFGEVKRRVEEAVEEGPIPHEVDVVDFDRAAEPFRSVAIKDRIVWKNGSST